MGEFLGSLGVFGWAVLAAAAFGLATLPRALREMVRRPRAARRDGEGRGGTDGRG